MPYYVAEKINHRPCGPVLFEGSEAECEAFLYAIPDWHLKAALCWRSDCPPPRRLSTESLASKRRKTLLTRLRKRFPLIADQLYQAELEARPGYFAGERPQTGD